MDALVLSGGGTRSMAHFGVLDGIDQLWVWSPDVVIGTSGGGLVAALWGAAVTNVQRAHLLYRLMHDVALHGRSSVIRLAWRQALGDLLHGGPVQGVLSARPLFDTFASVLPSPATLQMGQLPRKIILVAFNLSTGRQILFPSYRLSPEQLYACHERQWEVAPLETLVLDAMHATMALPGLFRPHQIGPSYFCDGGVVDNFPLDVAALIQADTAIGVNLGGQFTRLGTESAGWMRIVSDAIWTLLADATQAREATVTMPRVILRPDVKQFAQTDLGALKAIYQTGQRSVATNRVALDALIGVSEKNSENTP